MPKGTTAAASRFEPRTSQYTLVLSTEPQQLLNGLDDNHNYWYYGRDGMTWKVLLMMRP